MNIEAKIRDTVSMEKAFAMYCPEIKPRSGRIPCPIHGGTHYNLSYTDRVFYCHTCGVGGDVITFVEKLLHIDRAQAIMHIASDFRIVVGKGSASVARASQIARKRYLEERSKKLAFHKLQVEKLILTRRTLWNLFPEADAVVQELDDILCATDLGDDVPDKAMFTEDISEFCARLLLPYVTKLIDDIDEAMK